MRCFLFCISLVFTLYAPFRLSATRTALYRRGRCPTSKRWFSGPHLMCCRSVLHIPLSVLFNNSLPVPPGSQLPYPLESWSLRSAAAYLHRGRRSQPLPEVHSQKLSSCSSGPPDHSTSANSGASVDISAFSLVFAAEMKPCCSASSAYSPVVIAFRNARTAFKSSPSTRELMT